MPIPARAEALAARLLLAILFAAGAVQKAVDPAPAAALLSGAGLPGWWVWPALGFNAAGAACLALGVALRPAARALAAYCLVTSAFHFVPGDGWQISIMVKNWALAGGLLAVAASAEPRRPL